MNTKTKYMIPVFAAVFALVFAFAPLVMADGGAPWGDGAKHHGPKGHMENHAIQIDGFAGAIKIPDEMTPETHDSLKSQVDVTLGQAVSVAENNGFTDAMRAGIGIIQNESGDKYLVWTITSITKGTENNTITANIFVVDAGDAANFATTSKTFDHSQMKERMHGDKAAMFEKFKQKFSEPTGNADVDAARAQFLDLKQQLRDAIKNGDTDTAQSIKKQLEELRPSLFLNKESWS
jgi:hypothetical protein